MRTVITIEYAEAQTIRLLRRGWCSAYFESKLMKFLTSGSEDEVSAVSSQLVELTVISQFRDETAKKKQKMEKSRSWAF